MLTPLKFNTAEWVVVSRSNDKAEQEVRFWRRYIHWWEREHGAPAPVRMYEALAHAERRAADAEDFDVDSEQLPDR